VTVLEVQSPEFKLYSHPKKKKERERKRERETMKRQASNWQTILARRI
jgi:hypothetical protein